MLDAVRGWLTPPVLFVFINVVIGTIAVMSKLVSSSAGGNGGGDQRRSLMRGPSVAFDRLRCFSFSRLGLPADYTPSPQYQPASFHDDGGEWSRMSLLRAPSLALDRLRGFSFSRRGPAADPAPATPPSDGASTYDAEPSSPVRQALAVAKMEREEAKEQTTHIERSRSEAAARRPRVRKTRMARTEQREVEAAGAAGGRHLPPPVEVDARADDFIRQFREELRLQRLDSILRSQDTLRRTGTV